MSNDNVNGNVNAILDEIRALKSEANGFLVNDYRTGYLSALSALEGFIAGLPAVGVSKWISIEERLPEEINGNDSENVSSSDLVIVVVCDDMNNRFVSDDILAGGEWVNYPKSMFEVTHWMPLPVPPGEDGT